MPVWQRQKFSNPKSVLDLYRLSIRFRLIRPWIDVTSSRSGKSIYAIFQKNGNSYFWSATSRSKKIAGPKVLEHLVDTVIYFEGDGGSQLRALRAVKIDLDQLVKWVFEMLEHGLVEVPDACQTSERVQGVAGTTVLAALEGSRTILAEVQALVGQPTPATPEELSWVWTGDDFKCC